MNQKRILNILLSIVAVLLFVNLGVTHFPVAHAIPTTQYKVISLRVDMPIHPDKVELALNQQSADGWVYVGEAQGVLIFKK